MRYLLAGCFSIAITTACFAREGDGGSPDNSLAIAANQTSNAGLFLPWRFTLTYFTLDKKIPREENALGTGIQTTLQYSFSPNFYTYAGPIRFKNNKYGFVVDDGVTTQILKRFFPYAEGYYNIVPSPNPGGTTTGIVGYDIGMSMIAFTWLSPTFEVDNFANSQNETFSGALQFNLTAHYDIELWYVYVPAQTSANNVQVKLDILF